MLNSFGSVEFSFSLSWRCIFFVTISQVLLLCIIFGVKESSPMATISFTTKLDLTLTPKQFVFIDTSDYAGQGITTSNVNGCFTIVAPSGVTIYNNTDFSNANCDIRVGVSTTNQTTIPLPIDSSDLVELGNYTVLYTVHDSNLNVDYTSQVTFDNEYVAPDVEIGVNVDVISQIFSQTDNTSYAVGGVTPTIIRQNKLIYPQGIPGGAPAPIITSAQTLTTSIFYNGPQTSTILSNVVYSFTDFSVEDNLFGSKYTDVDGSYYCSIACSLKNYEKKLSGCTDNALRDTYEKNFNLAMAYVSLIEVCIKCNGGTGISDYIESIKDIVGADCGCNDCCDEEFSRVTGWGVLLGRNGQDGTNGTNGTNGVDGANGVAVLYNTNSGSGTATTGGVYTTLLSYTVPAGEMSANGDTIKWEGWMSKTIAADVFTFYSKVQGATISSHQFGGGVMYVKVLGSISRINATSSFYQMQVYAYDINRALLSTASNFRTVSALVIAANPTAIEMGAQLAVAPAPSGNVTASQLLVTSLKI